MTRKKPTPEMSAIQKGAHKFAKTKGPAAIKRAIKLAKKGANRMKNAQEPLQFPRW